MPAATAALTSMPGVLVPAIEARMELRLTAEFVVDVLDTRVLIAEVELIAFTCFCEVAGLCVLLAYPRT